LRDGALDLSVEVGADGMARITRLSAGVPSAVAALPLLDVLVTGEGKASSSGRYCESEAGRRFAYAGHQQSSGQHWRELRVDLAEARTGLRAEVHYRVLTGTGALRSWVLLANGGTEPVVIEAVTSFLCGGLGEADDLDVLWADNEWLAESRWQRRPLREFLPDLGRRALHHDPRGRFALTSTGTWSSGTYLPVGALVSRSSGHAWAWQVEHNGAWHWQVGDSARHSAEGGFGGGHAGPDSPSGAYVALLGPADAEHHWLATLMPGDAFTTVPVTVAVSAGGIDGALAALTAARRAVRRPHDDHRRLPVVYNDYMNTLMGDPTPERLLPLIDAAAEAGAEYFCIDAGWHAGPGEEWWGAVGAWKPSQARFPGGFSVILERIREAGMVPGLWLEPEVVGAGSPVARLLPPEAFFQRGGRRVVEHGRYHLDLRHPAAVKHLDESVDFLARELGVGYLKLDYNINPGPGTDVGGLSAGAGLLAANRAHLDWLDGVLGRHPGLVLENCSSGGMRVDYALLSRMQLQSTSDQQDYLRYPPIAASAPAAMTPEQAANWAYPQPSFSDDQIAFTLCGSLLGRLYLSGHLDAMSPSQRALVAEAVRAYRAIRCDIPASVPFWPLGLPGWTDSWIALGLRAPGVTYLTVWHRGPFAQGPDEPRAILPVPHLKDRAVTPTVVYPVGAGGRADWNAASGQLAVSLPRAPSACVLALAG
jgi:alpha-galactosidase